MTEELFKKNINNWSLLCPAEAEMVSHLMSYSVTCVNDDHGVPNLVKDVSGEKQYFYSTENPLAEGYQWFSGLDLKNKNALVVFGVGLGYYFDAIKPWLKQDPERFLVFLENDAEVLFHLLHTERGAEIVADTQVRLYYFKELNKVDEQLDKVAARIIFKEFIVSALRHYDATQPSYCRELFTKLAYLQNMRNTYSGEILSAGEMFFTNFYQNIFKLPKSGYANSLYGKFTGIPAIICGAGPSLDKNLALLETLGDKALIFAGGTALNAVSSNGFMPHFGAGIDPNETHLYRLMSNQAYEIPFFYRNRMLPAALQEVHGDRLYVKGTSGYMISNWFESQLNLQGVDVEEGHNVINFSVSLAAAMGCNPIILVGVDLAYTNNHSYQSGVLNHPLHSRQKEFRTKNAIEELLIANDINGQPIHTLWKWVMESNWFGMKAQKNPEILFVNATEGGLPLPGIPNISLQEVVNRLLSNQFDFSGMIHTEVEASRLPATVDNSKIMTLLDEFKESLLRCKKLVNQLFIEHIKNGEKFWRSQEVPLDFTSEVITSSLNELKIEPAYLFLLKDYDFNYRSIHELQAENLVLDSVIEPITPENIRKAKLLINDSRVYGFLEKVIDTNLSGMQFAKEENHKANEARIEAKAPAIPQKEIDLEGYQFEKGEYSIFDPELGIAFKETINQQEEPFLLHYPNGQLKAENLYLQGVLHGPSIYYSAEGGILSKTWFVQGKPHGKALFYYASGAIKCVHRFKLGVLQGIQEYFYEDGTVKTRLPYLEGKLNGMVELYYPTAIRKREVPFVLGKRNGIERKWNENGVLIIEVEYSANTPVGAAKAWYSNGQLAQEVIYNMRAEPISTQYWNAHGDVLVNNSGKDDYFDKVTMQTGDLTNTLGHVVEQLEKVLPFLHFKSADEVSSINEDLANLQNNLAHLQGVGEELMFESGLDQSNQGETIWKTPMSKQAVEIRLEEMTKEMGEKLNSMREMLEKSQIAEQQSRLIYKKIPDDPKDVKKS